MTNWLMYPDNQILSRDWFNRVAIDLTHCGRDKIDTMLQTPFSNAIFWMKMFELRLKFHWIMFLKVQLTIFQHLFRKWLGVEQATSHYLNQWWHNSQTNICVTRPQRCIYISLPVMPSEVFDMLFLYRYNYHVSVLLSILTQIMYSDNRILSFDYFNRILLSELGWTLALCRPVYVIIITSSRPGAKWAP